MIISCILNLFELIIEGAITNSTLSWYWDKCKWNRRSFYWSSLTNQCSFCNASHLWVQKIYKIDVVLLRLWLFNWLNTYFYFLLFVLLTLEEDLYQDPVRSNFGNNWQYHQSSELNLKNRILGWHKIMSGNQYKK